MLTLHNISCQREGRLLCQGVGVSVGAGGILAIQGANGIGKTTLLRVMAGIMAPEKGEVLFNGVNIRECLEEYYALLQYVGHEPAIKMYLSVEENLLFWARLRNMEELVPAALHYFSLEAFRHWPCQRLSKGMQRKVALARLMVSHTTLWFLDEPFVHLDEAAKTYLTELMRVRCEQGGIIVLTCHEKLLLDKVCYIELQDFIH